MSNPTIAVTGATGAVGGRVAKRLADRGVSTRLIVRDASRAPQMPGSEVVEAQYERQSMAAALQGIETVFLVSGFEAADRLQQHKAAIDGICQAGVRQVVYTSFLGASADATFTFARDHFHTEEYLASKGLDFVALRNNLYADIVPFLSTDGVIRGPAGEGRFAPVARDDVADVAVAVLLDPAFTTRRHDITGPELFTMEEVAALLTEIGGQSVTFEDETMEQAYQSRARFDAPKFEIDGWVSSYRAIAVGEMAVTSDAVELSHGAPAQRRCARFWKREVDRGGALPTPSAGRHRLLAPIVVETAAGFAAEPACFDIFHQKRAGAVFGIGQAVMEHLHDRQAGVEPDEISQLQRPHRMVGRQVSSPCRWLRPIRRLHKACRSPR